MTAANDNAPDAEVPKLRSACPICGKPSTAEMRPFCSKRCADVDLHRWFGGRYVIPGKPEDDTLQEDGEE